MVYYISRSIAEVIKITCISVESCENDRKIKKKKRLKLFAGFFAYPRNLIKYFRYVHHLCSQIVPNYSLHDADLLHFLENTFDQKRISANPSPSPSAGARSFE